MPEVGMQNPLDCLNAAKRQVYGLHAPDQLSIFVFGNSQQPLPL